MHTRYFQRGTSTVAFKDINSEWEKGLYITELTKQWVKENFPKSDALLHSSIISLGIKNIIPEINIITICNDEQFETVRNYLILLHPELEGKIFKFKKTEDRKNSYADYTATKMARAILKIKNIHRDRGFNLSEVNFLELHNLLKKLNERSRAQSGSTVSPIQR